jgi:ribosomal protein S27AE
MRNEMMCPSCGSAIHPTLFECLPAYSRKQYKCPRCGAWITLDGRSRFIMFVVGISVFNAVLWPNTRCESARHRLGSSHTAPA